MKSETNLKNIKILSILFLITLLLVSLFMINTVLAAEKETYSFITKWGYTGSDEGQFNHPSGIAVDSFGNVFVVDAGNNRIQKFSNDGIFLTQWGSYGFEDGQFNYTYYDSKYNRTVVSSAGVAIDDADNVYVTDIYNNRIQKFSNDGTFLTEWVYNSNNEKMLPIDITIDPSGNMYVNNDTQVLRLVNDEWQIFWSERLYPDGRPAGYLRDIAVDNAGYVYVLDGSYSYPVGTIQKFDSNGVLINRWSAGSYESPGDSGPVSLTVDDAGFIYLTGTGDYGEQSPALEHFKSTGSIVSGVTKFTNSGEIVTWWGNPGTYSYHANSDSDGQFNNPTSIVVDNLGNVFVADTGNNRIQKFAKIPDSTLRGNWFFDENQETIAYDNSIYHNDGLIFGASWINGVSGSALNFDGIDDCVYVVASASLKPQHFTVKAWVKLKSNGPTHFDSSPLTKGWGVLACSFTNSFMPQAFFGLKFIGDQDWTTLTSTETFPLDRWLPVVYMYDGTFMKIFVNGEEKASLAKVGTIDWSDDTLLFGANNWGGYDYSIIDEIKIYDRAYPYPTKMITETIRPWWQISLTDGLTTTLQINEPNTDYDTTYFSVTNSEDYSFILDNLTVLPFITAYYSYLSNYQISSVTVNVVAETVGIQSSFLNLNIETWGEKHTSPNIEILANQGYKTISYTWNYNPATNFNWTKNEVDDLHAGFSVQTNNEVRITQLYVTVKIPWIEMTQNLISNGDFSYNFTSRWKNYSLPWYLVIYDPNNDGYNGTLTTTSDAYEGNYSGLFNATNRSTSNTGYIIARTGISSYSYSTGTLIGKMLKLEFYYKGSMTVYPNLYCFNLVYDSEHRYILEKELLQVFSGPACLPVDSWTYVSMIFGLIPTGTTSTEIHLDVSTTGEFYFDNVNVTKITTIDYPWIPY